MMLLGIKKDGWPNKYHLIHIKQTNQQKRLPGLLCPNWYYGEKWAQT
jgi:hypothetical protein